jgi:DNA topoisomerase VI subunit B
MDKSLDRAIFKTSREAEYFTEKELQAQIGHARAWWPLAILRELIDNSLDACEMAKVAPEIDITVDEEHLTVSDNGPGIPPEIIEKSLDYMIRVSDKAYYVSPTRGQMGNALKVVWAAPFVTSGESLIEVIAQGEKHSINVKMDLIRGKPSIDHIKEPFVKNGTSIKIEWPELTSLVSGQSSDSYEHEYRTKYPIACALVDQFHAFNPHATFSVNGKVYPATDPTWEKWSPDMPTSAHWYNPDTLRNLIAAYIASEQDGGRMRTVREFVSEFRGLSSTVKQKEVSADWSGDHLHDYVKDGDVDREFVSALLGRMQKSSNAPKPRALGIIGKEHFTAWMKGHGATESSIKYVCKKGIDGLPYMIETAFGVFKEDSTHLIVTGFNWSPVLTGDPDPTIRQMVQNARIDPHDPVLLMIHIARPRFEFMDRGKTRTEL